MFIYRYCDRGYDLGWDTKSDADADADTTTNEWEMFYTVDAMRWYEYDGTAHHANSDVFRIFCNSHDRII